MQCEKIIDMGLSLLKLFKIKLVTFLRHAVVTSSDRFSANCCFALSDGSAE